MRGTTPAFAYLGQQGIFLIDRHVPEKEAWKISAVGICCHPANSRSSWIKRRAFVLLTSFCYGKIEGKKGSKKFCSWFEWSVEIPRLFDKLRAQYTKGERRRTLIMEKNQGFGIYSLARRNTLQLL